ncbi:6-carboxytetrahydropterin synthase [Lamprobacter modestohalophilus]|uniref:6-pyruvoyl trahydropterin synthase family protein n=1 Tax=Lamprobacter modestohalophilus TaxID=1064514 RepID=UPI002ADEDAB9|nr:6-carboxytetrahydropterin synthase [Lamprobacter modestohalophilus]MEA1050468.1 6-carboxytetrahydropterin synthase [Lamprobacter modestohalophilus]
MITATRYHEIDCGHRVVGQGGRCEHLHGHRYTIHFTCATDRLNDIGMVIDFGVIKERLCQWLEDHWDHRLLLWSQDPLGYGLATITPESVVEVPFNPTAENMAEHLLRVIGPTQLEGTGVRLIRCTVEETRKCSATATLEAV